MNWTAIQTVIHTFAIAHNAYVTETDWNETLIYEQDKVIFQRAKLSIFPCAKAKTTSNTSEVGRMPKELTTLVKVQTIASTTKVCIRHIKAQVYFLPTMLDSVFADQLEAAWSYLA